MLLAYSLFWFGIVFFLGLIAYQIFKKGIAPLFVRKTHRFERLLRTSDLVTHSGQYSTEQQLLTYFLQNEKTDRYKQEHYKGILSAAIFRAALEKLFKIEIISQVCEWDKSNCIHAIRCIAPGGNTFYMSFTTNMLLWTGSRDLYKKTKEGSTKVPLEENQFEAIRSITLLRGADIENTCADMVDLYNILEEAEITPIYPQVTRERVTNIVRFAYNSQLGYYLQETPQTIKLYPTEVVDASYNNMKISYQGIEQELLPSQAMEIARIALMNKRNLFTFGVMGCGKTTWARQIMAGLEDEDNVRLVSITPAMIGHLQNPQAQAELINLLSTKRELEVFNYDTQEYEWKVEATLNIIFIDEAEVLLAKTDTGIHSEAQSFLLSMMDGELQDILNCRTILVFNKDKEALNPAIFRSMRGGLEFNVTPITMERAKTLVGLLKLENVKLRFDEQKFHNFITDVSRASDGTVYAAGGFTTLADVVSCFTEPELDDAIILALRGMSIPKGAKKETPKLQFKLGNSLPTTKVAALRDPVVKESHVVKEPTIKATIPVKKEQVPQPATQQKKKDNRNRWRGKKH